jgi:hypothetical protein
MTSINEECRAARAAKAVISTLSTTTRPNSTSLAPLHHAYRIVVLHLSDEGHLNEARRNVGIALSTLIHSQPTPEKIDKAKGAVENWISELRSAVSSGDNQSPRLRPEPLFSGKR